MSFDNFFEDLEAQFEAAQNRPIAQIINGQSALAEVQDQGFAHHLLVAPMLGCDFIAGLDKTLPIWNIFSFKMVRSIRFVPGEEPDLPKAREVQKSLVAHLGEVASPMAIEWRGVDDENFRSANLVGISGELLLIAKGDSVIGVPAQRIGQIKVLSVDNFGYQF
ncbi:hypothetical protein [Rhodoluna limnophila]|uniref:hypothetical protein n=1 Tax=Rhodoluna limnophila TaxID=232537 RepID=UPI00110728FB|nr:hypothetical protein [Rhodoluna limnophila]